MTVSPRLRLRGDSAGLVLLLGALTAFAPMSIDMYLPAFPAIARDLRAPLATVQLSVAAFLVGSAIGQLFYGPLADRWGRRRPLLLGIGLYVVATGGCAAAGSVETLLAWRVAMALGGGAGMVIARTVVRDLFDTAAAARMFSLLMLVMGLAPILAPLAGGQILLLAGWRGIFAVLALFGLTTLAVTALALPETMPAGQRSAAGLAPAMAAYGELLRHRAYLLYAVSLGCIAGVNFAYISGAPMLFIELHGISPQRFGLLFGANAAGLIGASQLNRRLLRSRHPRQILTAAFLANAAASLLFLLAGATGVGGFPAQMALIFVALCMTGFLYPNATALALAPFGRRAGSASALLGTIQYAIGALAGCAVGAWHTASAVPIATVMAVCALTGLGAALGARRAEGDRDRRR